MQIYTFLLLLLTACSIPIYTHNKILLLTFAYNKPEFIELQYKTFQQFLVDDYEFIIINDANEPTMFKQIVDTCNAYNLACINIPQEIHQRPYLDRPKGPFILSNYNSANARNCNVVQYALDTIDFSQFDIVALFDADLFLINKFSISEFLKDYELAGYDRLDFSLPRRSKSFLWIGLIFLNVSSSLQKNAFNVNCGYISKSVVDSGGYSNYYLELIKPKTYYFERIQVESFICNACKQEKKYRCNHNKEILQQNQFDEKQIQFIQDTPIDWGSGSETIGMETGRNLEFFLNRTFVHYQAASNYAPKSAIGIDMAQFHKDKTAAFQSFINLILD